MISGEIFIKDLLQGDNIRSHEVTELGEVDAILQTLLQFHCQRQRFFNTCLSPSVADSDKSNHSYLLFMGLFHAL